ncbi:hypothetical protein CTI12_AA243130 [Artemisia annua]|uniref:Uncharacterized protein n=1 Tax=Artemisia annua TaxID=35608 RepID=A0A2U1NPP1_ARTAN|nr:hypothetical protein CTI12_AA243130 [Artemisia annua]
MAANYAKVLGIIEVLISLPFRKLMKNPNFRKFVIDGLTGLIMKNYHPVNQDLAFSFSHNILLWETNDARDPNATYEDMWFPKHVFFCRNLGLIKGSKYGLVNLACKDPKSCPKRFGQTCHGLHGLSKGSKYGCYPRS